MTHPDAPPPARSPEDPPPSPARQARGDVSGRAASRASRAGVCLGILAEGRGLVDVFPPRGGRQTAKRSDEGDAEQGSRQTSKAPLMGPCDPAAFWRVVPLIRPSGPPSPARGEGRHKVSSAFCAIRQNPKAHPRADAGRPSPLGVFRRSPGERARILSSPLDGSRRSSVIGGRGRPAPRSFGVPSSRRTASKIMSRSTFKAKVSAVKSLAFRGLRPMDSVASRRTEPGPARESGLTDFQPARILRTSPTAPPRPHPLHRRPGPPDRGRDISQRSGAPPVPRGR